VRLRKRAAGLLVGAGLLFVMGTNAQAGWLLVLAAVFAGAALAGVVLPLAGLRGLQVELRAPTEAEQGGDASVDVVLHHRGRGVRWMLRVSDGHLSATETFLDSIGADERVELTTRRIPARRGTARATVVEVRTAAPLGVAERRRRFAVAASTLVLPRVIPLGLLPFVDPAGTSELAIHSLPRRGGGPDYLGIREYRSGDSMRHVHWPSTARHGAVMVREFEEERTRRVVVVLDTERDEGESWTPMDRCCSVAASIASSALAHGHGARLVAGRRGGEVDVMGRADEHALLRWLAELPASGAPVAGVLTMLGPDALRGAETLVVVLPAWPQETASPIHAVAGLVARIPKVVCVPVGTAPEGQPDPALDSLVTRLTSVGAEVRPWAVGADLAAALGAAR
jgi:uncharacterized protein (DUF58 family)